MSDHPESASTSKPRDGKGRFVKRTAEKAISDLTGEAELTNTEQRAMETLKNELDNAESSVRELSERIEDLEVELETTKMIGESATDAHNKQRQSLKEKQKELDKRLNEISLTRSGIDKNEEEELDIKVKSPEDFDGTPKQIRPFLTQCELVFALRPAKFASPKSKLLYVLAHCNKGTALAFKEKALADQGKLMKDLAERATKNGINSWEAMKELLQETFGNVSIKAEAQHKLMHIKQGNRRVEEYVVEFKLLGMEAQLDGEALTVFFKEGLKYPIRQRIYESGKIPETVNEWAERALAIDIGWRESQLGKQSQNKNYGKARAAQTQQRGPRLSEEEFQKRRNDKLCFKCGFKGHFAKECRVKARKTQVEETTEGETMEIENQDFI